MTKPSQERHNKEREEILADLRALQEQVPDGSYAVQDGKGALQFYSVIKNNDRTTLTDVGHEDGPHRVSVIKEEMRILALIAADPEGCAERFREHIEAGGPSAGIR